MDGRYDEEYYLSKIDIVTGEHEDRLLDFQLNGGFLFPNQILITD